MLLRLYKSPLPLLMIWFASTGYAQVASTPAIPYDPNLHIHLQNRLAYGPTPTDTRSIAVNAVKWFEENLNASYTEPARLNSLLATMALPVDHDQFNDNNIIETVAKIQIAYALYSRNQLQQQMTNFWDNHFSTEYNKIRMYYKNGVMIPNAEAMKIAAYFEWKENREFRANALGSFLDLLEISAYGPSMMIYLDTIKSEMADPNENYARELMELHTVGVNGHSQADVIQASKLFTGLEIRRVSPTDYGNPLATEINAPEALALGDADNDSIVGQSDVLQIQGDWGTSNPKSDVNGDGTVDQLDLDIVLANWGLRTWVEGPYYNEDDYIGGFKTIFTGTDQIVLGDNTNGTRAQKFSEIEDFLVHLAQLDRTASYVCAKLVVKFVSPLDADDVPNWPADIGSLHSAAVTTWHNTNGDIKEVLRTIFTHKEFHQSNSGNRWTKTETPFESAISTIRALETGDTTVPGAVDIVAELDEIRESIEEKSFHPFFKVRPPTGFPEESPPGSGNLLGRMKLAEQTCVGVNALGYDWATIIPPPATSPDVPYLVQEMLELLYGPRGYSVAEKSLAEEYLNKVITDQGLTTHAEFCSVLAAFLTNFPRGYQQ